ncbi:MAG TPA: PspA/IM30 family protein, partial [Kofleriaceae bacterium]|nr:PspA/IM30 family protein [Kofleriaceae bacterium]
WVAQKQAVDKLKDALRLLNQKIEEAKRTKNILIARKKRAEAQQQIAATMSSLGDTSAFDTFERMADQITMLEAEAEAGAELAGELSGDALEAQFLQLESAAGGGADDELAELKAKMGLLGTGNTVDTKKLTAGQEGAASGNNARSAGASLTAEDLKELEDLDLSGLDMDDGKEDAEADAVAEKV